MRPTPEQLETARNGTIPDVLADGLGILFVGINPSLYSAAVGHHFARPGNRFWPALHAGGLTDRVLSPFEDATLVTYGCGLTNVVARATARADELDAAELRAGAAQLEAKVDHHVPGRVVFLGITAYRTAYGEKRAVLGEQSRRIADRPVQVLPNPSGLNAHHQLADFARMFCDLATGLR